MKRRSERSKNLRPRNYFIIGCPNLGRSMNSLKNRKELPYGSYKKKKDVSTPKRFASTRPNTSKSKKKTTGKDYKKAGLPNSTCRTSILTAKPTKTCRRMKNNALDRKK